MMAKGAGVRLERLWKVFDGNVVAVRDVSLTVMPGEFVTLLGPSGSGKTTALMMIAGFVSPSHGEIYIDERPVSQVPPQKRDLGMVFQNYALFPHMTVAENIAFPLEVRRLSRDEIQRRVGWALEMVRLPGYEHRYPRQLSGGQQQRIALARAIVFQPRVLLMDEPLGALDKKLREEMQLELKHLQRHLNITVIYVTHDQEEALTMSDRIAVMRDGRIEQVGTPKDVYEEPRNIFVADFIGESNFLKGIVRSIEPTGLVEIEHSSGHIFWAHGLRHPPRGAHVIAALRPERLSIVDGIAPPGERNRWPGRVVEVIYVGEATRYKVAIGDEVITVKEQNRERERKINVGDTVELVWNPYHTRILDDEHGAESFGAFRSPTEHVKVPRDS